MKRTVEFLDEQRNKVTAECEVKNGRFSMSGEYCGSLGQVFDEVKPANDSQKELIDIWRKYQLNDMNAGTPAQEEALKKSITESDLKESAVRLLVIQKRNEHIKNHMKYLESIGVDAVSTLCEIENSNRKMEGKEPIVGMGAMTRYLSEQFADDQDVVGYAVHNVDEFLKDEFLNKKYAILNHFGLLYDVHPETGDQYKYGSGWIKNDLPEDFEDNLESVLDSIEEIEEENSERQVEETDIDLFEDFDEPETALALALMLELSISDIEDIQEDGDNRWCVQGVDYLCGTDDEMDVLWDEDLDNYLEECVYPELPDNMRNYFDDDAWKRDAKMDGRAHSLNRYDGDELSESINGTWFYAYRQ